MGCTNSAVLMALGGRVLWAIVLTGWLGCTAVDAGEEASTGDAGGATRLPLIDGGVWQQFRMPDAWIRAQMGEIAPKRVVLTLLPPHAGDYAAFTPCRPPSRIVLGVVDEASKLHEHLLLCPDACDESTEPALWGYRSHLLGISLDLLEDGALEIVAHYKRRSDDPAPLEGPASFAPPTVGEERMRRHRLTPEDVRAAVQRESISTCGELLDLD